MGHSRESGNPACSTIVLDARLRGHDKSSAVSVRRLHQPVVCPLPRLLRVGLSRKLIGMAINLPYFYLSELRQDYHCITKVRYDDRTIFEDKVEHMAKEKAEALELIQKLPDDVTTTTPMEELFFKQQVDKGLQDVEEGRVLTHQELKEKIARGRK